MKRTSIVSAILGLSLICLQTTKAADPQTAAPQDQTQQCKDGQCKPGQGKFGQWRSRHGGHPGMQDWGKMLNLTDDQKAKIKEIFKTQKPKIEAIRKEEREKMKAVMDDAKKQIRPLLTPEQQKVLDDKEKLHQDISALQPQTK